ncbi:hypothetical protein Acr_24g0006030 [Actinidia rufa]|uniref:Uncharacterized protein n=1 Tax=Actinidia rufa TaxID=165716 RepID=A0A7J0GUE9_9ERIC|nr:hypothetical protein Acr_24g0006030 [Actinidia rufa]
MDTQEEVGQNGFAEDESENSAQLLFPPVIHTMYHINGPEDVVLPRPTMPVRDVPRSVIGIKEAGPSRCRNHFGKIRRTACKSVSCLAYFKKLLLQAQLEGSHEVNSPYRPNTLERARKRTLDPELVFVNFVRTVLAVDTLMRQMKVSFNAEDLLHVYIVVRPKREPDTPFLKGNWEFRAGDDGLWSFLRYNGHLPGGGRGDDFISMIDSNAGPKSVRTSFKLLTTVGLRGSEKKVKEEVISQLVLNRQRNWVPPLVEQVVFVRPIFIFNLDNEHSDDLAYAPLQLAREVEIDHNFREGNDFDTTSSETNIGRLKTQGQKKSTLTADPSAIAGVESSSSESPLLDKHKGKDLTMGPPKCPRRKDHDTSLALAQAIMLSNDVIDLVEEGSEEIRYLLVMQQVQSLQKATAISEQMKEQSAKIKESKKKISSLEKQAKLDFQVVEKARLEITAAVQERDASNVAITEAWKEVAAIQYFNEEEMLEVEVEEEEADEVPEEAPKVPKELGQETVENGVVTTIVEDRAVVEEASLNLSPDL